MFAKIQASRALSRAAAIAATGQSPPLIELSIAAKVFSTQNAFEVADSAVQLVCGKGQGLPDRETLSQYVPRSSKMAATIFWHWSERVRFLCDPLLDA